MTKNAHHMFSVEDAIQYGAEKAILLQNIRFWLDYSQSNGSNVKKAANGTYYYWTYNSATAFGHLFPYMSARTIERHLKQLIEMGVLIKECHNKAAYDRTSWYTTADYESSQKHVDSMHEKSQMNAQKIVNERTDFCEPIPYINTNINPYSLIGAPSARSTKKVNDGIIPFGKEHKQAEVPSTDIAKLFGVFYKTNPDLNFGNKTHRAAAAELIKRHGLDKAIQMAEAAVALQGRPFIPTITNPLELKNNFTKLKAAYEQQEAIRAERSAMEKRRLPFVSKTL